MGKIKNRLIVSRLTFKPLTRGCRCTFTLLLLFSLWGCTSFAEQSSAGACKNNLGSDIKNFCVVTPHLLWRGARPHKEGAAWLIQNGVKTVVNLELILDDNSAFAHATLSDAKNYEVGYFRIHDWEPLPLFAPSVVDDHVAHFLAIVTQQPKPVYVHCRSGVNRSGVMVAAYRVIIEDVAEEQAIEEMKLYQGVWFNADASYIRGLTAIRREEVRQKVTVWLTKLHQDARVQCSNGRCVVTKF
ncbi:MAG: dual specificity protein phosphatase family protein [Desulfuromonadaceae bacterium]|nr:dual specificity protein phosphatase family protein [Desulfuromonadaceae bacterium]MDD5105465.1 dual specificity protein phosphatase family protein [Desulfuromonadaceae bacterium]